MTSIEIIMEMPSLYTVSLSVDQGVATLTLLQHTLSLLQVREIDWCLNHLENSTGPLCLVTRARGVELLRGPYPGEDQTRGGGVELLRGPYEICDFLSEFSRLIGRVLQLSFPSVVVLEGGIKGCWVSFVMAHDVRIWLNSESKIEFFEHNSGVGLPRNLAAPLLAKLPPRALRDLGLIGLSLCVREAKASGLVDFLAENIGDLETEVQRVALELAEFGGKRAAYRAIKTSLYKEYIEMTRRVMEEESWEALKQFHIKL